MRPKQFRIRRYATAGFTAALVFGGVGILGALPAGAAADGVSSITSVAISPVTAPTIYTGLGDQTASSYTFTLPNNFIAGDTITFQVAPHTNANCTTSTTDYVGFATAPTVTAAGNTGGSGNNVADTTPTFTASLSSASGDPSACTSVPVDDVLTITLNKTSTGTSTDTYEVTVPVEYNVGATADTGTVKVSLNSLTSTGTATAYTAPTPNATVALKVNSTATGNSPATVVTANSSGSVSNIVVTEGAPGAITGSICISPSSTGPSFSFSGTPEAAASPSTGSPAGVVGTAALSGADVLVPITAASTGTATTYTISGLSITSNNAVTGLATANVTTGGASCAADTSSIATGVAVTGVAPVVNTSVYGTDADGTAAAELAKAFPAPSDCPPGGNVVLATDQGYQDALSASYLAGYLKTGILLTPTAAVSSETLQAIRDEGITTIYTVGGPLAVSQSVLTQLASTPAYECGGTTATGSNLTVEAPIYGQTAYDTSEDIALYPGLNNVESLDVSGAYGSLYNDTTGNSSSAPSSTTARLKTAIVASGASFQDAASASVMAYNNQYPLILTDPTALSSQATAALQELDIQQVIVLGGPIAVSDADVTSIEALNSGITVVRLAGQDATDTSQEIASFELNQSGGTSPLGLGWGNTSSTGWQNELLVARSDFYSDALAGCVMGHVQGGTSHTIPLVLTENPTTIGQYLTGFLTAGGSVAGIDGLNAVSGYSGDIQTIQGLGGPLALSFSTLEAIASTVASG